MYIYIERERLEQIYFLLDYKYQLHNQVQVSTVVYSSTGCLHILQNNKFINVIFIYIPILQFLYIFSLF